jgi:hypothetical protein
MTPRALRQHTLRCLLQHSKAQIQRMFAAHLSLHISEHARICTHTERPMVPLLPEHNTPFQLSSHGSLPVL